MRNADTLRVKLFADGADLAAIRRAVANPQIRGFTTNPTLMRKAGVSDYETFARQVLEEVTDRSVSFEVFADTLEEMEAQARVIASWGANVAVKIPITNTQGVSTASIIRRLSRDGITINVTAMLTLDQVRTVAVALSPDTPAIVSIFAGRIADAGIDPVPVMREALTILKSCPKAELLWASPREIFNVIQADAVGCHIITATPDILAKLSLLGKDLTEFSLETVRMFYNDAAVSAYSIRTLSNIPL